MSSEEMKEMVNLRMRVMQLERMKLQHCKGCQRLLEDYTGTFHVCPMMGSVEPEKDGCSRRI